MDLNKFEIYKPTYSEENKEDVLKEIQERGEHLKELNIFGSPDSDLLRVIGNASSSLMTLKLQNLNNGIKASDFDFISNCNQLKCLNLKFSSSNSRSAKEINQILKRHSKLEELCLFFQSENLEEICFPSTLKRLYFRSNNSTNGRNIEHIMNIGDCCPDLEHLRFHNVILNEDLEFLEYLGEGCPNIIFLDLYFNGTINFSFLGKFPNLKYFIFEHHGSTIDPSDLFSMIPQIEGLYFISLPSGFSSEPDFSKLPHLKTIGFNSDEIGNTIINNIKDLQTLEKVIIHSISLDFFYKILPLLPNLTCVCLPQVKYDYAVFARLKLLNKKRKNKLEVQLMINDDVIVSNYTTDNFIVKKFKYLFD